MEPFKVKGSKNLRGGGFWICAEDISSDDGKEKPNRANGSSFSSSSAAEVFTSTEMLPCPVIFDKGSYEFVDCHKRRISSPCSTPLALWGVVPDKIHVKQSRTNIAPPVYLADGVYACALHFDEGGHLQYNQKEVKAIGKNLQGATFSVSFGSSNPMKFDSFGFPTPTVVHQETAEKLKITRPMILTAFKVDGVVTPISYPIRLTLTT